MFQRDICLRQREETSFLLVWDTQWVGDRLDTRIFDDMKAGRMSVVAKPRGYMVYGEEISAYR